MQVIICALKPFKPHRVSTSDRREGEMKGSAPATLCHHHRRSQTTNDEPGRMCQQNFIHNYTDSRPTLGSPMRTDLDLFSPEHLLRKLDILADRPQSPHLQASAASAACEHTPLRRWMGMIGKLAIVGLDDVPCLGKRAVWHPC